MEREWKPNVEITPHCPRCGSSNTKFCYYNNYSLTQPRYFCKGCRRYWTKGGSLRNVPVGGGCRKNRRVKNLRSTTDGAPSKNLVYGGVPNGPNGPNGNLLNEPTSSSVMPSGSSIDLAVVYANFLNQPTDSKTGGELPEFPSDINPMSNIVFSSVCDTIPSERSEDIYSNTNNNNQICLSELDLVHKQQERVQIQQYMTIQDTSNNGLPPLPGEEVSWLSSPMMSPVHNPSQPMQFPSGVEQEAQDLNQVVGQWIPFDLPSYDTFSTGLK